MEAERKGTFLNWPYHYVTARCPEHRLKRHNKTVCVWVLYAHGTWLPN